jgi:hypothetical protein
MDIYIQEEALNLNNQFHGCRDSIFSTTPYKCGGGNPLVHASFKVFHKHTIYYNSNKVSKSLIIYTILIIISWVWSHFENNCRGLGFGTKFKT